MTEITLPSLGGSPPTYPTFASFPTSAPDGSLAIALDTDTLYAFNATGSTWVLIGPASGAGMYTVNLFTLNGTDITNKFVVLSATPANATKTVLTVQGGPAQEYGADYTVTVANVDWNGLGLDGVLVAGDKLIVQFY